MPELLLELFSEEIPARMQKRASEDLQKLITNALVDAGITYQSAAAFATPRRLCLVIEGLLEKSPAVSEERKGPKVGAPEKAVQGFLRATGLTIDQLEARDTKKGAVYFAKIDKPGRAVSEILSEVLPQIFQNFPWPKSMRWGSSSFRWVRPLQSVLCIINQEDGAEVVPFEIGGLESGDSTVGHRFMAPGRFAVTSFNDYQAKLSKAFVRLNPDERSEHIRADAETLAFAKGLEVVEDEALVEEVAGLVEWPVVLMGDIDDAFLDLPVEVLQTSMREHQKFFSVRNPKTDRIEKFITVANRETADNGATILAGNQKVLFARLSDAKFFWENDLRIPLTEMGAKLENVTFQRELGTEAKRIERITSLTAEVAPLVGADVELAKTAATVAKADLSSEMVYEFPELQGLMGRYYALKAGLPQEVADACQQHYSPLGPKDEVPTSAVSIAVSLADKLDKLTGFWAIDEKPTGSKDPFALRRAALGIIRIVLENDLSINIERLIDIQLLEHEIALNLDTAKEQDLFFLHRMTDEIAKFGVFGAAFHAVVDKLDGQDNDFDTTDGSWLSAIKAKLPALSDDLLGFFHDRLKVYLKDRGIRHDIIDACLSMPGNGDFGLLVKRAKALEEFLSTKDGENLLQGVKRANNILAAEEKKDGVAYEGEPEVKFADADTEIALFAALDVAEKEIGSAVGSFDFAQAMVALAKLRGPIDAFFTDVQVNAESQIVRRNRLCLLNRIRQIGAGIAEFGVIEG